MPAIPNPLHDLHNSANAEFQDYAPVQIVSTFGQPEAEYAAIRKSVALIDQPQRGFLELTGEDRLGFLNNLLTNQTWDKGTKSGLREGQGIYAFFLARNGRIVAEINVLERGQRTFLEMDARLVETVRASFEKYLFNEKVKLSERLESLHQISLHGPGALAVLCETAGAGIPELAPLASTEIRLLDTPITVWRDDPAAVPGYHLVVPTEAAANIWSHLIERFGTSTDPGQRRLRPAGWAAFNAARIEGGRPIFGIDFNDSMLPHETGQLDRAVSFTKGCYLGQEIVARMHARGQWARQLAGIKMADDALPIAGATIVDDNDNQIGGITSSTVSPVLSNAAICLALLKKPFFNVGSVVNIPAEGSMRKGTVVDLPFVRPTAPRQ